MNRFETKRVGLKRFCQIDCHYRTKDARMAIPVRVNTYVRGVASPFFTPHRPNPLDQDLNSRFVDFRALVADRPHLMVNFWHTLESDL